MPSSRSRSRRRKNAAQAVAENANLVKALSVIDAFMTLALAALAGIAGATGVDLVYDLITLLQLPHVGMWALGLSAEMPLTTWLLALEAVALAADSAAVGTRIYLYVACLISGCGLWTLTQNVAINGLILIMLILGVKRMVSTVHLYRQQKHVKRD